MMMIIIIIIIVTIIIIIIIIIIINIIIIIIITIIIKADGSLFRHLQTEIITNRLKSLNNDVSKTLITSAIRPPLSWSVYELSIRTTNDVEGWHNRMNKHSRLVCHSIC